jgi:hypothetical protein
VKRTTYVRMKNATDYSTADLKRLLLRLLPEELDLRKFQTGRQKPLLVSVAWAGSDRVHGKAVLRGHMIWLWLPRPSRCPLHHVDVALVMAHELAHIRGQNHAAMRGAARYDYRNPAYKTFYAWAADFPIALKTPAPKAKPDPQLALYARTLAGVRRWETKLKRATKALQKLRKRRSYYERVLTAAGKLPKASDD